jgi:hypothetical protein
MWLKVAALVVLIVGPPMTAARAQTAADLTVDALISVRWIDTPIWTPRSSTSRRHKAAYGRPDFDRTRCSI